MSDEIKKEIIEFLKLKEPCGIKGAELYHKHGSNSALKNVYNQSPNRYISQMRWELAKLIGIGLIDFQKGYFTSARKADIDQLPEVIVKIKAALPALFNRRAEIQKALASLPDNNEESTLDKAKELGEMADVLAIRHQLLSDAKELYFDEGIKPNEQELFPMENEDSDNKAPVPSNPFGLKGKDSGEIWKRKKNLESSLTKDRNLLAYQSKSKPQNGQENPMPESPEKDKILARVENKSQELHAINEFLKEKEGEKENVD